MMNIYHTILAEGNGGAVKLCQKEAGVQSHELTNRNSIRDHDESLFHFLLACRRILIAPFHVTPVVQLREFQACSQALS